MLEWLKTILGDAYTDEIDGKVSAEIGKGFVAKADFNAKNEELKTAHAAVKERDAQMETLQKSTGDINTLKQQLADLQKENTTKAEEHAAQIAALQLNGAVDKALSAARAKNVTAAKALLGDFLKGAKVEDDGSVRGLSDEIKKMTENQDTSFLFTPATGGEKANLAGAAPAGHAGSTGAGNGVNGTGGQTPTLASAIQTALLGNQ